MNNSESGFHKPVLIVFSEAPPTLRLVLYGYAPKSPNRIGGRHWSILKRDHAKARDALKAVIESPSGVTAVRQWIGTMPPPA